MVAQVSAWRNHVLAHSTRADRLKLRQLLMAVDAI